MPDNVDNDMSRNTENNQQEFYVIRRDDPPRLNPLGNPPNQPGQQPIENRPDTPFTPERALELSLEARGTNVYTIPGEDLIRAVKEAEPDNGDIGEIIREVQRAMAFTEGLESDIYTSEYQNILDLQDMFTTVEGSIERPSASYLEAAIEEKLRRPLREATEMRRNPRWDQQKRRQLEEQYRTHNTSRIMEARPPIPQEQITVLVDNAIATERQRLERYDRNREQLQAMEAHFDARRTFDRAFRQRQEQCENADGQGDLASKYPRPETPDKGQLEAFFKIDQEFGDAVDATMRAIVGVSHGQFEGQGIPANIYVTGFKTTEQFQTWYEQMARAAGGRMDVLWNAWKMTLFMELLTDKGIRVKENQEWEFASPPFMSSLMAGIRYTDQQRATEYGWDSREQRIPTKPYKAIEKSGHPLSIGRIGKLCEDYLHETKVKVGGEDTSLFDIWWGNGRPPEQGGTGMRLSDEDFPWAAQGGGGQIAGEVEPGSIGGWFLKRNRANKAKKLVTSIPKLQEIASLEWWEKLRDYDKAKIIKPNINQQVYDPSLSNPFAWWLAGVLYYYSPNADTKYVKAAGKERMYGTEYVKGKYSSEKVKQVDSKVITLEEIMTYAQMSGAISKSEVQWMYTNITGGSPTFLA